MDIKLDRLCFESVKTSMCFISTTSFFLSLDSLQWTWASMYLRLHDHTQTYPYSVGLLRMSDQPNTETCP